MRSFARLAVALTLSATAVAALTWAGWPRPRFVVPLPAMAKSAAVQSESKLPLELPHMNVNRPPTPARTPWVGFTIRESSGFQVTRNDLWWVNLQDGRTAGSGDTLNATANAWDHRGAAVVGGASPPAFPEAGAIGRFDPEAARHTVICDDRHPDFIVSRNGETLLTFTSPRRAGVADPRHDADLVCFDLTADPPTRTRIDLTIPYGRPLTRHDLHEVSNRLGGVALSPDGQTLAVAETWRRHELVTPRGVRLFDARTGLAKRTLTDYGPQLRNPAHWDDGAHGLVFSPDSRFVRLHWLPRQWDARPVHSPHAEGALDRAGPRQLIDTDTGAYVPPPHLGYAPDRGPLPGPLVSRTAGDSLRLETDGDPAGGDPPFRLRVVAADGTPRCDWRTLSPAERGGLPVAPGGHFVSGTTGLVWMNATPAPRLNRYSNLFRRVLRLPPPKPGVEVVWYDWSADEFRVVRRLTDAAPGFEGVQVFVQEGRLERISSCHSGYPAWWM